MGIRAGLSESGSRILDILKFIEGFGGGPEENTMTVVWMGRYKGLAEVHI